MRAEALKGKPFPDLSQLPSFIKQSSEAGRAGRPDLIPPRTSVIDPLSHRDRF